MTAVAVMSTSPCGTPAPREVAAWVPRTSRSASLRSSGPELVLVSLTPPPAPGRLQGPSAAIRNAPGTEPGNTGPRSRDGGRWPCPRCAAHGEYAGDPFDPDGVAAVVASALAWGLWALALLGLAA